MTTAAMRNPERNQTRNPGGRREGLELSGEEYRRDLRAICDDLEGRVWGQLTGRLSALEVRVGALDDLAERVETLEDQELEMEFDYEALHARLVEVECENLALRSDNMKDLEEEVKASPKASPKKEMMASPQASPIMEEITRLGTMVRQQLDAASSAPPSPPPALPCITPTTTTSEQYRLAKVENDMMHLEHREELTLLEVARLGDAVQQLLDAAGSTPPPPAAFTPPPPPALPCITPGCPFGKHLDGASLDFPDRCCLDCKHHNRKSYQGRHGERCGGIRV